MVFFEDLRLTDMANTQNFVKVLRAFYPAYVPIVQTNEYEIWFHRNVISNAIDVVDM